MAEKNTYLIGIDIGTQGVKGALFRSDGFCVAEWGEASRLLHPQPGVTIEDPEFQYASSLRVIKTLLEQGSAQSVQPEHIAALAIDGQMAGIIGVGSDGMAVTPYDSWLDYRCTSYLSMMKELAFDRILEKAGTAPSINHGPKKLWWKHEHPEVYKKITKFVQPGGYVASRLCGLTGDRGFIDKTYLHFSGFSDTANGIWDEELCRIFDLDMDKLPHIVNSTDIVGTIAPEAAGFCGLVVGTPVAAGCGDTVASFLSTGAVESGISVDVAGTASVFAVAHNTFSPDTQHGILGCCASVVDNLFYSYAYINGGGMNPEWFVKQFSGETGPQRFSEIEKEVMGVADSATLPLFIPHLAGRVMPGKPNLRGSFAGLSWDHGKPHLYRAILEGVALEYGLYKRAANALQPDLKINEIRITGGGENSQAWNLMKSAVLQAPVVRIKRNQGAPLGIAMVAAVAVGIKDSFLEASNEWVTHGEEIAAPSSRYPFFERRLNAYEAYLQTMEAFCDHFPFNE